MAARNLTSRLVRFNDRRANILRCHRFYRYEYPCGPDTCVYCGDPASSEDHLLPLSYVGQLAPASLERPEIKRALVVVPACLACNTMLSCYVGFTVAQKRAELKRRLRRKYARLLGTTEWGADELTELGPSLRTWVEALDARARALWLRYTFNGVERWF
jgi:hypothetical protein